MHNLFLARSMGYHVRNDKIEDIDMFLKRMEGIMRVYASVLITAPRKPDQQSPLGLAEAWRWCCAFLNLDPRPDIAPIMLISFLEVTGHEMFRSYGKQFKKILAYVCKDYLPLLEQVRTLIFTNHIFRQIFSKKKKKKFRGCWVENLFSRNWWFFSTNKILHINWRKKCR